MRFEPAGEPHVRHARGGVGMVVGEELHIDAADRQLELIEPDGGAAAGVDQELLVAGLDQRAGAEAVGARNRDAGSEQCYAEIVGHHGLILMPASLMTLLQCAVSERTSAPNASGVPPPGSVPSLASASRTLSVLSALLTASLSRAMTAGGVPAFSRRPAQSSAASLGYPASTMVGTSLSTATRLRPITASARSLPALICCTTGRIVMN